MPLGKMLFYKTAWSMLQVKLPNTRGLMKNHCWLHQQQQGLAVIPELKTILKQQLSFCPRCSKDSHNSLRNLLYVAFDTINSCSVIYTYVIAMWLITLHGPSKSYSSFFIIRSGQAAQAEKEVIARVNVVLYVQIRLPYIPVVGILKYFISDWKRIMGDADIPYIISDMYIEIDNIQPEQCKVPFLIHLIKRRSNIMKNDP